MDDLLTSYISQMLTTMSKQRNSRGQSKWTFDWREAVELVRLLRPIGRPCSWGRAFASQLWRMSRTPSASSQGSVYPDEDSSSASSEDDYLWTKLKGLGKGVKNLIYVSFVGLFAPEYIIWLNAQFRYHLLSFVKFSWVEYELEWLSYMHLEAFINILEICAVFLTITAMNKQYLDTLGGKNIVNALRTILAWVSGGFDRIWEFCDLSLTF